MNVIKDGGGAGVMEDGLHEGVESGDAEERQKIMKQENSSLAVLLFNFKLY